MVRFVESGGEDDLAPVIPLFAGSAADRPAAAARPASGGGPVARRSRGRSVDTVERSLETEERSVDADPPVGPAALERMLLRRLGARGLSVREAEDFLRTRGMDRDAATELVSAFCERGYLDDGRLAEQLVWSGANRRSEGRQAIARRLAQRGVDREAADAALAELPDDDDERALAFARGKAPSLARLDPDVALRRLAGQLARRGFGGSSALSAARTALQEARSTE